jgi:large subunit ribosomal protein L27
MAHKKGQGATRNGRDTAGRRLGIKVADGAVVKAGGIIVRQRGLQFRPALNTKMGRDFTIFSLIEGRVRFAGGHQVVVTPLG